MASSPNPTPSPLSDDDYSSTDEYDSLSDYLSDSDPFDESEPSETEQTEETEDEEEHVSDFDEISDNNAEEEEQEVVAAEGQEEEQKQKTNNHDVGAVSEESTGFPDCPICFMPWSHEGPHRISCFPCGHVYGRSCLEKWLRQCSGTTGKCPQCNRKFRKKNIINIYAPPSLVASDSLVKEVHYLREENESLRLEQVEGSTSCQNDFQTWSPSSPVDARRVSDASHVTMSEITELKERVTALEVQVTHLADLQSSHLASLQSDMSELRSQVAELRVEMAEIRSISAENRRMNAEIQVAKRRRLNNDGDDGDGASESVDRVEES